MTNEIVNYDEVLAQLAKKATAAEKPSSSSISARAGILAYNGTPVPGNKLECIIIASTHANLLYDEKYDPNNPKSPICYAYCEDPEAEGAVMKPHPKSAKPQAENCADCKWNKWGSDPEGGRGKACKNTRRLAILPAGVEAADVPTAEVATMALPVMTVAKKWAPYVHKLATLYGRPPLAMKTVIGTQPDQKAQFMITFDDLGPVDNALLGPLIKRAEGMKPILEQEYEPNEEPTEGEVKAQQGKEARNKKF